METKQQTSQTGGARGCANSEPVLLEEAIVVEVVLEVLELLGGALVDPILGFGAEIGIVGGDEGRGLEGRGFGGQVAEAALDIVPLRARAFHVLVHEVVIRH